MNISRTKFSRIVLVLAVFLTWSFFLSAAHAERSKIREYKIKAAYLYNFAKFVEWPAEAFDKNTDGTITIHVLGEDPFGEILDKGIEGKSVKGRELVIKRFERFKEVVDSCQILFVGTLKDNHLSGILEELRDSTVLTVGETEGFTRMGGVISFMLEGDKVRFEINREAAERAGLKISSKLLKLSRIVKDK